MIVQGEETDREITLVWIPGQRDHGRITQIKAKAEDHLANIHAARQCLGLPPIPQQQVPVYPVDSRLRAFWTRRGAQTVARQTQQMPEHRSETSCYKSPLEFVVSLPPDKYNARSGWHGHYPLSSNVETPLTSNKNGHTTSEDSMALGYILEDPEPEATQPATVSPKSLAPESTATRCAALEPTERTDGSRCKKCIKTHKKCNRQRPCQNCKVRRDCVSEDETTKSRRLKNKQPIATEVSKVSKATKTTRLKRAPRVTKAQKVDKIPEKNGVKRETEILQAKEGTLTSYESVFDLRPETWPTPKEPETTRLEQAILPLTTSSQSIIPTAWRMPDKSEPFHQKHALHFPIAPCQQIVSNAWRTPERLEPSNVERIALSAVSSSQPIISIAQQVWSNDKKHTKYQSLHPSLHDNPTWRDVRDSVEMDIDPVSVTPIASLLSLPKDAMTLPAVTGSPRSPSSIVSQPTSVQLQAKDHDVQESVIPHDLPGRVSQAAAEDVDSLKMSSGTDRNTMAITIGADLIPDDTIVSDVMEIMHSPDMEESYILANISNQNLVLERTKEAVVIPSETEAGMNDVGETLEVALEMPCMDCGQDTGHRWDCHIGSMFALGDVFT